MSTAASPPLFDELIDLLAETTPSEKLRAFRLSPAKQARLDELFEQNRAGTLSPRGAAELDTFEQFEHVVRLLKARTAGGPPA